MKTIKLTTRVRCSVGHTWAPGRVPGLAGSPYDSTIITEFHTEPITIDLDLRDLGKCPGCGDAVIAVRFEATPSEMV